MPVDSAEKPSLQAKSGGLSARCALLLLFTGVDGAKGTYHWGFLFDLLHLILNGNLAFFDALKARNDLVQFIDYFLIGHMEPSFRFYQDAQIQPQIKPQGLGTLASLILVFANAGIGGVTPVGKASLSTFEEIIRTNLTAVFFAVQAAEPYPKEGASIILNGSVLVITFNMHPNIATPLKSWISGFARAEEWRYVDREVDIRAAWPRTDRKFSLSSDGSCCVDSDTEFSTASTNAKPMQNRFSLTPESVSCPFGLSPSDLNKGVPSAPATRLLPATLDQRRHGPIKIVVIIGAHMLVHQLDSCFFVLVLEKARQRS